jgi:hypothetical protein
VRCCVCCKLVSHDATCVARQVVLVHRSIAYVLLSFWWSQVEQAVLTDVAAATTMRHLNDSSVHFSCSALSASPSAQHTYAIQ